MSELRDNLARALSDSDVRTLITLNAADCVMTCFAYENGVPEANPLMDLALSHSLPLFIFIKLFVVTLLVLVIWHGMRERRWAMQLLCMIYAIVVGWQVVGATLMVFPGIIS